jgi:hypothetical protein
MGMFVYGNKPSVVFPTDLLKYLNYKNTWLTSPRLSVGMLSLRGNKFEDKTLPGIEGNFCFTTANKVSY